MTGRYVGGRLVMTPRPPIFDALDERIAERQRREREGEPTENLGRTVYMAVIDTAAHDGHVREVSGPAWPAEGGWTYQDITGAHGAVLVEGLRRAPVQAALDAWLVCSDAHCYTHGRGSRS